MPGSLIWFAFARKKQGHHRHFDAIQRDQFLLCDLCGVALDNVSIHENKTNKELFFLQSVKVHDRANPDKPDEQVAAWLFPRGVCAYNNTYTELCNEDLDRRFYGKKQVCHDILW